LTKIRTMLIREQVPIRLEVDSVGTKRPWDYFSNISSKVGAAELNKKNTKSSVKIEFKIVCYGYRNMRIYYVTFLPTFWQFYVTKNVTNSDFLASISEHEISKIVIV